MASGKPRAPQFIVANTLPTESVLQEIIRHRDLVALSLETCEVVNWLARHRLLKNTIQCGVCHGACSLTAYHQHVDGLRWKCRPCNFVKSIRDGSFFAISHLPLTSGKLAADSSISCRHPLCYLG